MLVVLVHVIVVVRVIAAEEKCGAPHVVAPNLTGHPGSDGCESHPPPLCVQARGSLKDLVHIVLIATC
jgi:hypothetical protein